MRYFRNLRTYDMLIVEEKRKIAPYASEYLAEELAKQEYAKKRRKAIMQAQREIENEGEEVRNSRNPSRDL